MPTADRFLMSTILVTGGAGFIGANFVHYWLGRREGRVVNLDKLTYAGNPENLAAIEGSARHELVRGDIGDRALVSSLLRTHQPGGGGQLRRRESRRSLDHGTGGLRRDESASAPSPCSTRSRPTGARSKATRATRSASCTCPPTRSTARSGPTIAAFSETTPYAPNSPYSASKAGSDHLVRAYHHTYGLPVLTTNCSNNYGPFQFPEKLIPLIIHNALAGKPLPIYGDGTNVRDWLYVEDHCSAIARVLDTGRAGETYNVGGNSERQNIAVVHTLCDILDELAPRAAGSYKELITFVRDRPGHDRRYAIDPTKIRTELAWEPSFTFEAGMRQTVRWYLDHQDWVQRVTSGAYREWVTTHYGH